MISKIINEETIEKIKSDDFYKNALDIVKKGADEELGRAYPDLAFNKFMLFKNTGDRKEYESEYFVKRKRLNYFTLMLLLYKEEKYKAAIEDCIWNICSEFTWCLPAHIDYNEPVEKWQTRIDLFAAETGGALSEVLSLIGEEISVQVRDFARKEIKRRIIDSYLAKKNQFFWETADSNWAAVCAGSVGIAMLYEASEAEIKEALPRILDTMKCYLGGFYNDGCCMEGGSYWSYGFGFFTYFADMLYKYTNGETNLFASEKVHRIAEFKSNMILGKSRSVSFSDASAEFTVNPGLSAYIADIYNDISAFPPEFYELPGVDTNYRWFTFIRDFAWAKKCEKDSFKNTEYKFYSDAAWYIRNTGKYGFAAKGGYNDEPHNHNDIGSFIFVSDNKQILADFGAGKYTRQYFSDERYSYLVTSSRGHSVPIINGEYQKSGRNYRAEVISADKNAFEIDMSGAYGIEGFFLKRRFTMTGDGICISDAISMDREFDLTERFFTCIKPEICGGEVVIDGCRLIYDESLTAKINEDSIEINSGMKNVYLIDFIPKTRKEKYELKFYVNA